MVNWYSPIKPFLSEILATYSPGDGTGIVVEKSPELSANPFLVITCSGPYVKSPGPKTRIVSTPSPIPLILPLIVNACESGCVTGDVMEISSDLSVI